MGSHTRSALDLVYRSTEAGVSNLNFDLISRYRVLRPLGPTQLGHMYLSISSEDRSKAEAAREESRSPGFFCLEVLHPDWAKDDELRALFLE